MPSLSGIFSKLGSGFKTALPYIGPIANRIAAAAGSPESLQAELRQRELDRQDVLAQSALQSQAEQRKLQESELATQELQRK